MIKQPLLRNLSFNELMDEIENRHNSDPIYDEIARKWKDNEDELREQVTDLGNEVDSLRDERDDLECDLNSKNCYINWADRLTKHVIEKCNWEFKSTEEKTNSSVFAFENKYTFSYGDFEFKDRGQYYTYCAEAIIAHGDITKIEVTMGGVYNSQEITYECPMTEEDALKDAKMLLIKMIFLRVEYE